MKPYQHDFIEFALQRDALRFGEFTLKSGRVSPYFFNAGVFNTGEDLQKLGAFYANAIIDADIDFDVLFGPAYKGIPLVCAASMAFSAAHQKNIPFAFNRKEAKAHGEGGVLVGADINNKKVVIIDDVMTAGTAIRHSMELLEAEKAKLAATVILLDRQERGPDEVSAVQAIERDFNAPVISVIKLEDLIQYIGDTPEMSAYMPSIAGYREQYGV